eukprot:gene4155-5245_t
MNSTTQPENIIKNMEEVSAALWDDIAFKARKGQEEFTTSSRTDEADDDKAVTPSPPSSALVGHQNFVIRVTEGVTNHCKDILYNAQSNQFSAVDASHSSSASSSADVVLESAYILHTHAIPVEVSLWYRHEATAKGDGLGGSEGKRVVAEGEAEDGTQSPETVTQLHLLGAALLLLPKELLVVGYPMNLLLPVGGTDRTVRVAVL